MPRISSWALALSFSAICPGMLSGQDAGADARPAELAETLSVGDKAERRDAAYQLGRLGAAAAPALPELRAALRDDDDQVWAFAVMAIAKIGPGAEPAIPDLIAGLDPERRRYEQQVQHRTAFALSRIGDAAIEPLVAALGHDSEEIRAGAAQALGMMADAARPAVPDLVAALGDGDEAVRTHAGEALGAIGSTAVPALVGALASESARTRLGAAAALGAIGGDASPAQDKLLHLVECEASPEVRAVLLETLTGIGANSEALVGLLLEALDDDNEGVRVAAVNGLLGMRDSAASIVPALVERLSAGDLRQRQRSADVLGRMGSAAQAAVPALLAAIQREDGAGERSAYITALQGIGPSCAPELLDSLAAVDAEQVGADHWALRAIATFGVRALDALRTAAGSDHAGVRAGALLAIGDLGTQAKDSHPLLLEAWADPHPAVRAAALRALHSTDFAALALLPLLKKGIDEETPVVRSASVSVLGAIANEKLAGQAAPLLAGLLDDDDPRVVAAAARALAELESPPTAAIEPLTACLDGRTAEVQLAALQALAKFGGQAASALPAISAIASGSDDQQRIAAIATLGAIGAAARDALPILLAAIEPGQASELRAAAVTAFAQIETDPENSVPVLLAQLDDPQFAVRAPAIEALSQIGAGAAAAAPKLFALLESSDDREVALNALRAIRSRDVTLYIAALESSEVYVRLFACEALGRLGRDAETAIPALREAQRDRYDFIRRRAGEAIERIERALR